MDNGSERSPGRAVKVRVHRLDKAVRTDKLRLTVSRVAPPDACARLLQFEAWGRGDGS